MPTPYRLRGTPAESLDAFNRANRMEDFEEYVGQNPGAMPNGTGRTGLMSGDARGHSALLERQQQYVNDASMSAGRGPVSVRQGGPMGPARRSLADDPLSDFFGGGSIEDRQARSFVMQDAANRSRRADDLAYENVRGARIANEGASDRNREFRLHDDPAHQAGHDKIELDRGQRGFEQAIDQFFSPGNQQRLDQTERRARDASSHTAGLQRELQHGRDRINADADVRVADSTARAREGSARYDALSSLFRNDALSNALTSPDGTPNPVRDRMMRILDEVLGSGGQAAEKTADRAEVERFARARGIPLEQAMKLYADNGYAVR